jgi:hypothetical protein
MTLRAEARAVGHTAVTSFVVKSTVNKPVAVKQMVLHLVKKFTSSY